MNLVIIRFVSQSNETSGEHWQGEFMAIRWFFLFAFLVLGVNGWTDEGQSQLIAPELKPPTSMVPT